MNIPMLKWYTSIINLCSTNGNWNDLKILKNNANKQIALGKINLKIVPRTILEQKYKTQFNFMKTYNSWDKKQNERNKTLFMILFSSILYLVSTYNNKNNNDSKS